MIHNENLNPNPKITETKMDLFLIQKFQNSCTELNKIEVFELKFEFIGQAQISIQTLGFYLFFVLLF